ncbi:MAG: hypothetical protein H6Q10_2413 [Acidobacteria bacterium]|nr:hypothetical protein [Acidobacteriota bacterium]
MQIQSSGRMESRLAIDALIFAGSRSWARNAKYRFSAS